MRKPTGNPNGRPRKEIDYDNLEALVKMHATSEECAAFFDISLETLSTRVKEKYGYGFPRLYKNLQSQGKASLRRLQWANAQRGNVTMQIWLGKQHLGQSDQVSVGGRDGAPPVALAFDWSSLDSDTLRKVRGAFVAKNAEDDQDDDEAPESE